MINLFLISSVIVQNKINCMTQAEQAKTQPTNGEENPLASKKRRAETAKTNSQTTSLHAIEGSLNNCQLLEYVFYLPLGKLFNSLFGFMTSNEL